MAGSTGYLPTQLTNVYIYALNTDGTITAKNDNTAVGPLTATYNGTTWVYKDASGNVVLSTQSATAGAFQSTNGFISYSQSGGYLLISNDKIEDPSKVTWSNQAGTVPGSTPWPTFGGASSSLKITDTSGATSISYGKNSGGVTVKGVYDSTAHATMPGVPSGYLPTTLNDVYLYTLNADGTVSAQNNNTAVGPLTATYNGTTWVYKDASGNVVLSTQSATAGAFQNTNGFISYSQSGGYLLVSNDKIEDPSLVTWSNQAGTVPGSTPWPTFGGASSSLKITDTSGTTSISYGKNSGGVTVQGVYDSTAHATMPGVPLPSGYLPTTLNDVYIYALNADGTVTAKNDNTAIGPLTATYDGKTWVYKDASGNVILSAQSATTGAFQNTNGFISYSQSGGYLLVSNDKIDDPSKVTWSNQDGTVPGSTPWPSFGGASASLKITDASGTTTISYGKNSGGVTVQGVYDPTAHTTMPGVTIPSGYLPTTLNDVYIYTLNTDGTVSAQNDNTAIGPLTATYDGKTWVYKDASGNVILSAQNTTTGAYQLENGFISYSNASGYVLVSNDKIGDPSQVRWSNQDGAVPGTTAFPSFAGASSSLKLENLAGTENAVYERISGGVTAPGFYNPDAHFNMPCFLAGAMILTARGYCAVEDLSLDDKIAVFLGSAIEWRPIKALSTGICRVSSDPFPDLAGYPVVISKNALGDNKPSEDLRVTADHAIEIDGQLFMARSLVDGEKIYFDLSTKSYFYYHVDLHDHYVIEANGLRVESLVSHETTGVFKNAITRYNHDFSVVGPATQRPLCTEPEEIEKIRDAFDLQSSAALVPGEHAPLVFRIFGDDGRELARRPTNGQKVCFVVPAHVRRLKIVSDIARPYDAIGVHIEDRRKLGLLIGNVVMFEASATVAQKKHLEHRAGLGWSSREAGECRWTAGEAVLELDRRDPASEAILAFDVLDDCARFIHYR